MKTLHLRQHSIKDGPNNTIGPKGLLMAWREGSCVDSTVNFDKIFHGPLVRTAQTALAFCQGFGCVPDVMPVVNGLGDEALFAEIVTDEFKAAVKNGLSNFAATRHVHSHEKVKNWAQQGHTALLAMFYAMKDNEIGLGFFHSPTIELAAWACGASDCVTQNVLADMEGLIFTCDYRWEIRVIDKIIVKAGNAQ